MYAYAYAYSSLVSFVVVLSHVRGLNGQVVINVNYLSVTSVVTGSVLDCDEWCYSLKACLEKITLTVKGFLKISL